MFLTELQLKIIDKILDKPGISQKSIPKEIGESKQVVNCNLKLLERAGFVDVVRWGKDTTCIVTDKFKKLARQNFGDSTANW
jgi:predicted transcriptional regulator